MARDNSLFHLLRRGWSNFFLPDCLPNKCAPQHSKMSSSTSHLASFDGQSASNSTSSIIHTPTSSSSGNNVSSSIWSMSPISTGSVSATILSGNNNMGSSASPSSSWSSSSAQTSTGSVSASISFKSSSTSTVPSPTFLSSSLSATSKQNVGPIIGGVIGGLALLVLIAVLVYWFRRRSRRHVAPSAEFMNSPNGLSWINRTAYRAVDEESDAIPPTPAAQQLSSESLDEKRATFNGIAY